MMLVVFNFRAVTDLQYLLLEQPGFQRSMSADRHSAHLYASCSGVSAYPAAGFVIEPGYPEKWMEEKYCEVATSVRKECGVATSRSGTSDDNIRRCATHKALSSSMAARSFNHPVLMSHSSL